MKQKEFPISFEVPVEQPGIMVHLTATAELHHSNPYYVIHSFKIQQDMARENDVQGKNFLTRMEIKCVEENGTKRWVHCDSEQESELSRLAGKAIDKVMASAN